VNAKFTIGTNLNSKGFLTSPAFHCCRLWSPMSYWSHQSLS